MSAVEKLQKIQNKNNSVICLGLDLDPKRMPPDYAKSIKGMYDFTMRVIDATSDLVCAYKPNMAFYENLGHDGLSLLKSIVQRMPHDMVVIMDGKRGDIGNTASFYAESLYEKLGADWVTLNPYMGYDSLRPFIEYKDKGVFILCLTSNAGAKDFQLMPMEGGRPLYHVVAEKVDYWNKEGNCGLVVGATQPEQLKEIRTIAKNMPLLIPGVGAQGGDLELSVENGTAHFSRLAVINVSRSVLYASREMDFAQKARQELKRLNEIVTMLRSGEKKDPIDRLGIPNNVKGSETPNQEGPIPPQIITGGIPPSIETSPAVPPPQPLSDPDLPSTNLVQVDNIPTESNTATPTTPLGSPKVQTDASPALSIPPGNVATTAAESDRQQPQHSRSDQQHQNFPHHDRQDNRFHRREDRRFNSQGQRHQERKNIDNQGQPRPPQSESDRRSEGH